MKRGWITRDLAELPAAVFEARLDAVRKHLLAADLPAMMVYTDVWRSNQGRYFSNFMPYWNRALLVIPREGAPVLLCGLSPRVYPWIRSVTILDEIRPSASIPQQLEKMCAEKGWSRLGFLDLPQVPDELTLPNAVDIPWAAVHPEPDAAELSMYRHAAKMAREILTDELPGGAGKSGHEFAGQLERRYRHAGAEDLVILLANGLTAPAPASGLPLGPSFSVSVAMEYRGHWVKIARTLVGLPLESAGSTLELLSGPYPYEACGAAAVTPGALFAEVTEYRVDGNRIFHGDSFRMGHGGAELL
jgi:hypothetical protein